LTRHDSLDERQIANALDRERDVGQASGFRRLSAAPETWNRARFIGTNPRRQRWVSVRFGLKLQAGFRIDGNAPLSFL